MTDTPVSTRSTCPPAVSDLPDNPLLQCGDSTQSAHQPGGDLPRSSRSLAGVLFSRKLNKLVTDSQSKSELIRRAAERLQASGCQGLWIVPVQNEEEATRLGPAISVAEDDQELNSVISPHLNAIAQLAHKQGSTVDIQPKELGGPVLLAAPIRTGEWVTEILIGLYPASLASATPSAMALPPDWAIGASATAISEWQTAQVIRSSQTQLSRLSSFVNAAAAIHRTETRLETCITLVNELKNTFGVEHVALLLNDGHRAFRLAAMSGVEFFDRSAATTQTIEATVIGCGDEAVFWYPGKSSDSAICDAETQVNLHNYCSSFNAAGCALLPLKNQEGKTFGWLLLSLNEAQCGHPATEKHFQQIASLVAAQLDTIFRSQRTLFRVCRDNAKKLVQGKRFRKLAIAGLLVSLVLFLPMAYKIPCDCQLDLTRRRFVAAPYDGLLEKTLVNSGDVVDAGQVLARMDAGQLRMERSALTSELASERKKRDTALARGNIAESQIARSAMSRLESEISIIQNKLKNTEIRSPIDGVVVSGDLDKAEGAPLEMGKNLFEIGPLEQLLVEIHIPESQIQYVRKGMDVHFEFDAFPFDTFHGTIQRIHPRAEVVNSESVFVAEVEIDNPDGELRPGLKGRARVVGDRYPLGWNLFHDSIEKARHWLIW